MPIKYKPKSLDLMEIIEEERRRTIEDIPNEILLKIFYYLTFNDNITAGDVCKRYLSRGQIQRCGKGGNYFHFLVKVTKNEKISWLVFLLFTDKVNFLLVNKEKNSQEKKVNKQDS